MELYDLVKYLVNTFESLGIKYFITGSVASILYGEPRLTNDIDVVADVQERHIKDLLKLFSKEEFYISESSIRDAISRRSQFNIIHPLSGLKVDVIITKEDDFDNNRFERIKRISPVTDTLVNFSSPEDVIIMKLKYFKEGGSEKHIRDIASMLKISGDSIDRNYVEKWAQQLNLLDIWKAVIVKLKKLDSQFKA